MADPHLKSTLERKCAETERRIEEYQRQMLDAQKDLVNLRGTIALFERDAHKMGHSPSMSVTGLFKRGEVYQRCLSALDARAELDTSELATSCLEAKGLDTDDKHLRRAMTQMIIQVLHVRASDGTIVSTGKRGVTRVWRKAAMKKAG